MSTLQALLLPSDFIGLCNLFLLYIAYSTLYSRIDVTIAPKMNVTPIFSSVACSIPILTFASPVRICLPPFVPA